MVNNLKKVAEEVNTEAVEVEAMKEIKLVQEEVLKDVETEKSKEIVEVNVEAEKAVTEEQQIGEDEKKTKSLAEVKNENLEACDAGDEASVEEKQNVAEMKQTEISEKTKVPIIEVGQQSQRRRQWKLEQPGTCKGGRGCCTLVWLNREFNIFCK
ncbi:hypothetical protein HanRHA438_Chr03g0123411 [Helianthus annuus]|uniref:Uncharacterized protein n=1 Tax=Helianthus annuus TaxID=4232 RepID=A0A9K3JFX3_HELAN|nr:hypothetical protein HanXRQr2_Chr03g0111251 [Helianthus annuus]KAJ0600844.1 hypothetical protein HanIR_Chr03g0121691 [Helianthus annuus]KAJ0935782.1 hypothetical protein HanRHA438_Chr03g0123411 [Helianthus annuus]KAJ0943701.1 hypothetical protein HanPSC8_Chr03g0107741 [Helianthus annuus]